MNLHWQFRGEWVNYILLHSHTLYTSNIADRDELSDIF